MGSVTKTPSQSILFCFMGILLFTMVLIISRVMLHDTCYQTETHLPGINYGSPNTTVQTFGQENEALFEFPPWAGTNGSPQFVSYELPQIPSQPPYLFIAVQTAPHNFFRRKLIRDSWADPIHYPYEIDLKFIVGETNNISVAVNLTKEIESYRDIIQGDFEDSYDSLPLKTHLSLHWFVSLGDSESIFLKIDDDVFMNPYSLAGRFEEAKFHPKALICFAMRSRKPIREIGNKWFVSRRVYPSNHYPTYCLGMAYFITFPLAQELIRLAPRIPAQKSEDLYFTGILPERIAGVSMVDITPSYFHGHEEEDYSVTYMKLLDGMTLFAHTWQEYALYYSNLWTDILYRNSYS